MPSMLVLVPSYVPQCVEIFNGKNIFHIFHGMLQSGTECQLVQLQALKRQAVLLISDYF